MIKTKTILLALILIASSSARVFAQNTVEEAQKLLTNGDENKALELLENNNESENPIYFNLFGEIWLKKGNGEKALEYFEKAKNIAEEKGKSDTRLLGKTYNNIAVALWSMGKSSQALQYHQVALQYREKINEPLEVASSLNNIGLVYTTSQPELAIEYFEKAKKIYDKANLQDKIATSYVNIGLAFSNKQEYSEALTSLNKALDIRLEQYGKKSTSVGFVYTSLASVFLATEDHKFAKDYAKKALVIYTQMYGAKHPEIATT